MVTRTTLRTFLETKNCDCKQGTVHQLYIGVHETVSSSDIQFTLSVLNFLDPCGRYVLFNVLTVRSKMAQPELCDWTDAWHHKIDRSGNRKTPYENRIPGLDTVPWIFNVKSLNSPFIRVKLPIHSTYVLTSLYASICNEQCMISILTIINSFDYSFAWEKVWYIRKPSLGLDWMKLKDSVLSHEYQMRANRAGPGGA